MKYKSILLFFHVSWWAHGILHIFQFAPYVWFIFKKKKSLQIEPFKKQKTYDHFLGSC